MWVAEKLFTTGVIVFTVVILVKFLRGVDADAVAKWWWSFEMRKHYNYMYSIGAFTREQYLHKLDELENG